MSGDLEGDDGRDGERGVESGDDGHRQHGGHQHAQCAPPETVGRTAYRIVQEGLTNARKHAPARPVRVLLDGGPGDGLLIDIRNPLPDRPPATLPGGGVGLVGLAERAQLAGGRLGHEVVDGEFRLHAALPWPG